MKVRRVLLLMVLSLVFFMAGCGSDEASMDAAGEYYGDDYSDVNSDPEPPAPVVDEGELNGGDVVQTAEVPALEDRKIIYEADLEMQSPDPVTVYNSILEELDTYTAYVETANNTLNKYQLEIRVLSDNFTDFVEAIKTHGDLVSYSKTSTDITNTYSTYEIRLAALQARHDRILLLIAEATDLDVIFELEDERYDIEVELNQIGSALGNYDSLIDFSTVNVTINKTYEQEVILPKTEQPYIYISETTKYTTKVEVSNNSTESVNVYLDLLVNGEFVRQYEGEAFEDGTAVFEIDELDSNTDYQIRVTTIAAEHRESNVVRDVFTTEATFINKVGNVFTGSFEVLVVILEYIGLIIVAILPFAVAFAIVFIPGRILYVKYLKEYFIERRRKRIIKHNEMVERNQKRLEERRQKLNK